MSKVAQKIHGVMEVMQFDNWLQLLISRLFFRRSMDVYYYRGLEIVVDRQGGDVNGIRTCLATPMYRSFLNRMSLARTEISIVDLGANAGGFSLLLKADGYVLKKVVAVELNPRTYRRLALNLERNLGDSDLTVLNEAIHSRTEILELNLGRGGTSDSVALATAASASSRKYRIQATTLNDLLQRTIGEGSASLCKIDVEGAEWDVFLNAGCERIRQCENILMEIHPREQREPALLIDRLAAFGFQLASFDASTQVYWFKRS